VARSLTSTTRRDSIAIEVNWAGTPRRASSVRISSPAVPPASPAATTSCPNRFSIAATAGPRPPARYLTRPTGWVVPGRISLAS
jgi:hypothetical protein